MALEEKLHFDDIILYEVIRHPVFCGEFINNIDKLEYEEPFEYSWYQKEILCDFNPYVDVCTARATGKTVSLVSIITWILLNNIFPNDYIVYTVPNKVHLDPVFTGLIRVLRSNSFMKNFLDSSSTGINSSEFKITLNTGGVLLCRIAGNSGGGANVIGLHSPFVLLDEGGYYPHGTWVELQPTLNTFTNGFRLMVAGVPTGLRENNVLFHTDQENSNYTKHRVSALENPRFTEDDNEKAILQYGGTDSEDYVHLVLGLHGKPIFSLFDRSTMEIVSYPVYKLSLDGIQLQDNVAEYITRLVTFPGLPDRSSNCIIGIDLGYTEPTAIVILYQDSYGRMRFHGRIRLTKVSYSIQDRFIDHLDSKFNPSIIGIDEGSSGKAVIQRLQEDVEFAHKNYKKKLIPINFSSQVSLGLNEKGEEIKEKTKPFAVSVLQDYANNHKIIFSSMDLEMVTELERMTFSKTPTGDIVYKTLTERGGKRGEDHFTQGLLCGTLAYYLVNESFVPNNKTKLFSSRWILS